MIGYLFPVFHAKHTQAIDEFLYLSKNLSKCEPELLEGEWQMIWSSQVPFCIHIVIIPFVCRFPHTKRFDICIEILETI